MGALDIVGVVLLLGSLSLIALVVRRRLLMRGGGIVEMSLRQAAGHWTLGLARFESDRLLWFRTLSLSPRPRREFARTALHVHGRRQLHRAESLAMAMASDAVVLECAVDGRSIEIALPASASLGLLAWLEAGQRARSPASAHLQTKS